MSNLQCDLSVPPHDTDPVDSLTFHPVEARYRNVQMILTALLYLLLAAAALLLLLLDTPWWCILAEAVILAAMCVNLLILRKAWRFKGYALREQDITYRSGVIFPTVTTVPYRRVQQVSVQQNPVAKLFGLYTVEVANGAQALAALNIHGLSQENASSIKNFILTRLRNEPD